MHILVIVYLRFLKILFGYYENLITFIHCILLFLPYKVHIPYYFYRFIFGVPENSLFKSGGFFSFGHLPITQDCFIRKGRILNLKNEDADAQDMAIGVFPDTSILRSNNLPLCFTGKI